MNLNIIEPGKMLDQPSSVSSTPPANNHNGGSNNQLTPKQLNINGTTNMTSNQLDTASSANQLKRPLITQIAKVIYHNFLIGIFTDSGEQYPCRFFFEPVVLLDPKSIVNESHGLFKQDFVRLTIQMWNQEIRSKVLERLRSLPGLVNVIIQEDDVCVMPYEEVQLVCDPESIPNNSIRLKNRPISYRRSPESLDFYLLCDSPSVANALADDFRQNPEFTMSNLELALECRGLLLGADGDHDVEFGASNMQVKRPTFKFRVSVLPNEMDGATGAARGLPTRPTVDYEMQIRELQEQINEHKLCPSKVHEKQIKDLQDQMRDHKLHEKQIKDLKEQIVVISKRPDVPPSAIPIFSVLQCSNAVANDFSKTFSLAYSAFDIRIKKEYGDFNLKTGLFTVSVPGVYQFNFNSHVKFFKPQYGDKQCRKHKVELRVDGEPKAVSFSNWPYFEYSSEFYLLPIRISALVSLKLGETVDVFLSEGIIHECPPTFATRFSAILFTPK